MVIMVITYAGENLIGLLMQSHLLCLTTDNIIVEAGRLSIICDWRVI